MPENAKKKYNKLTPTEVEQVKDMVLKGVSPEDISKHFHIGISSVHNYKKRFKEEGLSVPDIRGKRPAGSINAPAGVRASGEVHSVSAYEPHSYTVETKSKSSTSQRIIGQLEMGIENSLKFIVNGVSVIVSAAAKNVSIGKDCIEIRF